jgi:hypothetical protein
VRQASLLIVLYLVLGEWSEYRRIVIHPELIVDKGRGEKMDIHLNMTFPRIPCELLTLDVMDVSGEQQTGVVHGIHKVRLSPAAEGGHDISISALDLHADPAKHIAPDYCTWLFSIPHFSFTMNLGVEQIIRNTWSTLSYAIQFSCIFERTSTDRYGPQVVNAMEPRRLRMDLRPAAARLAKK